MFLFSALLSHAAAAEIFFVFSLGKSKGKLEDLYPNRKKEKRKRKRELGRQVRYVPLTDTFQCII